MSTKRELLPDLAFTGAIAVAMQTTLAPMERLKLLYQCQGEMLKSGRLSMPYKGIIECTMRTYQTEGFLPFLRGNIISCIGLFTSQAASFAFKEIIRKTLNRTKSDSNLVNLGRNVASGGISGILTLSVVYSMHFTRVRLANDVLSGTKGATRQFSGIVDVYRKTMKSDGIVGLHRGFVISCVGIAVYRGCYFGFYDTLKPILLGEEASIFHKYALGVLVTLCAGICSYPFDTVSKRMMMTSGEPVKYRGSLDCFAQIIRNEGFMALMRGISVNFARGVVGAALLPCVDIIKQIYHKQRVRD